jgi:hypothetical protein
LTWHVEPGPWVVHSWGLLVSGAFPSSTLRCGRAGHRATPPITIS